MATMCAWEQDPNVHNGHAEIMKHGHIFIRHDHCVVLTNGFLMTVVMHNVETLDNVVNDRAEICARKLPE